MDDAEQELMVRVEVAKNLFKSDYVNEFTGIDIALQSVENGQLSLKKFREFCLDITNKKEGKAVLKFSEKYNLVPPQSFREEIQTIDTLVDKINNWIEAFVKNENDKDPSELAALIKEACAIIIVARKR